MLDLDLPKDWQSLYGFTQPCQQVGKVLLDSVKSVQLDPHLGRMRVKLGEASSLTTAPRAALPVYKQPVFSRDASTGVLTILFVADPVLGQFVLHQRMAPDWLIFYAIPGTLAPSSTLVDGHYLYPGSVSVSPSQIVIRLAPASQTPHTVQVRLTRSESTLEISFAHSLIPPTNYVSPLTGDCAVCLTALAESGSEISQTSCGHQFHLACLQRWLAEKSTCPSCRRRQDPEGTVGRVVLSGE